MTDKTFGKIVVPPDQRERIRGNTERLFIALYNKYSWETKGKHPLAAFREMDNPNGLNLETEIVKIDKYLISMVDESPGKIWRSFGWVDSFQNWLNRTKRSNLSIEGLKKPLKVSEIVRKEPNKYSILGNPKTTGELKFDYYEELGRDAQSEEEINESFMDMLESLREGFSHDTIHRHRNYYYGYPGISHNYMKELLELRIQIIVSESDSGTVSDFMKWLSYRAEWIVLHSFCDHVHDGKKTEKALTLNSLAHYYQGDEEPDPETIEDKVALDPSVIYTLADIRRMP